MKLGENGGPYFGLWIEEAELQFPRIATDENKYSGLSGERRVRYERRIEWRRQRDVFAWAIIRVQMAEPKWVGNCVSSISKKLARHEK
jgi:hypothetical protein